MKKILIILTILYGINIVSAQTITLTRTFIPNLFFERIAENYYKSLQYSTLDLDGQPAYCIETGVDIKTENYYSTSDLTLSGLDEQTIQTMFLYAYYGYGYENNNTLNYRVATQTLIWELASPYTFIYNTNLNGAGTTLDYSQEKLQIQTLVNNHYVTPNFQTDSITINKGETVTLTDINNVLQNYDVSSNELVTQVNGNTLTITATQTGDYNITFRKKTQNTNPQLIHYNQDSQKLITRSNPIEVTSNLQINVNNQLKVYKVDTSTNNIIPIKNIAFKIYDLINEQYICNQTCIFYTDTEGSFTTFLNEGNYKLEEIDQSIYGYLWNDEQIYFEVTKDSPSVIEIYFKNIEVKAEVHITKYGEEAIVNNGITYQEILLPNVKFQLIANQDIYTAYKQLIYKKGDIITTKITNDEGKLMFDDLHLGSYCIKEIETYTNHTLAEDICFTLEYADQYTNIIYPITVKNYLEKQEVTINKIDSETKLPLKGAIIEIYTIDDILISSHITDETGIIKLILPIGEYYILEKQAPDGYNKLEDKIFLTSNNITIANEPLEIVEIPNVPSTSKNASLYSFVILLIGGIYYKKIIYNK